jgi:zinc finger protein
VEGLLTLIRDKLLESDPYAAEATDSGGAALSDRRAAMGVFLDKLEGCIRGVAPFTLQIRDPMANSWVYSATAPAPDPTLSHEHYARSEVEDRDLGLLDMRTEGYGEEEAEEEGEEEEAEEEAEGAGAADSAASGAAAQPESAAAAGGAGGAAPATEGAAASLASGAFESSAAGGSAAGR